MNFIRLLPVILSILLLGAHFFRAGNIAFVLCAVVTLLILAVRRPWAAGLVRIVLVIGGIEWIRTAVILARMRQAAGAPWMRLVLILGAVAALTICSSFIFRLKPLRQRYNLTPGLQNKFE